MDIQLYMILILAVSGVSVLWRKLLIDFPTMEKWLQTTLGPLGYAMICACLLFTHLK